MNISDVTAAPVPVKFCGRELLMSPPTNGNHGELEKWLQAQYIQTTIDNLEKVPEKNRDALLANIFGKAGSITLQTREGKMMSNTVDAQARMLWMLFRPNHPDITFEEVRNYAVNNPIALGDAMLSLAFLIKSQHEKPDKASLKKKKIAKKKNR
jgi:hypothetical protein